MKISNETIHKYCKFYLKKPEDRFIAPKIFEKLVENYIQKGSIKKREYGLTDSDVKQIKDFASVIIQSENRKDVNFTLFKIERKLKEIEKKLT